MKNIIFGIISLFLLLTVCAAQGFPKSSRDQVPFPRDSALLNIKDSILIGKYFVAVKGLFYGGALSTDDPIAGRVFIKGYENKESISLKTLNGDCQIVSSDSTHPVLDGDIALLKVKNAWASLMYTLRVYDLKKIPQADILEEGDIIVFIGMRTYDGIKAYTFPSRWYTVTK